MSDLRELYQEMILEHNKNPKNYRAVEPCSHQAAGHNPLCGDKLVVQLRVANDIIEDIGFQGDGCAISKSSASLMTQALKGKSVSAAEQLFERFHTMVMTDISEPVDVSDIGKLKVFSGVREFPVRVKCATLAWHTFRAALTGEEVTSSER